MSRPHPRTPLQCPHRPICPTCINARMNSGATLPRSLSQWSKAGDVDPRLLEYEVQGEWWEALAECGITLLVTREYEHLVMALRPTPGGGRISYMSLPHPSGLAVDRTRMVVHIASTRNPNQVFDLIPVAGMRDRLDVPPTGPRTNWSRSARASIPGCLYIHDLAMIGGDLHANAVGQNAVVRLDDDGRAERVWWPKCIETENGPIFSRNHIQLNSIAAGQGPGRLVLLRLGEPGDRVRRPGHLRFPVDRRGVIFSGATREPFARGLTRPHSARLHRGTVWVDNSGYGELGFAEDGRFQPVVKLPGWTRGLCFSRGHRLRRDVARHPAVPAYAPGLDVDTSICARACRRHRVPATIRGQPESGRAATRSSRSTGCRGTSPAASPGLVGPEDGRHGSRALFYAFTTELNR